MSPARRIAILILLGVGVLVLSIIVQVWARDFQERLLAVTGVLGGLAIVVVSLPTSNGKNQGG